MQHILQDKHMAGDTLWGCDIVYIYVYINMMAQKEKTLKDIFIDQEII